MLNETLGLAYNFFVNFLTLWRNSSFGHPQPLGNFRLLAPLPLGISIDLLCGGGGVWIFSGTAHSKIHAFVLCRIHQSTNNIIVATVDSTDKNLVPMTMHVTAIVMLYVKMNPGQNDFKPG